ncbi:PD-(D/E)XK nuclease family protein [Geodermatophilus sp. SYSU D00710]
MSGGVEPQEPRDLIGAWRQRHAQLAASWQDLAAADRRRDLAEVTRWQARLADLRATHRTLLSTGRWRGGPRTLLAALNVHYRELPMTAGLAWLLRPDGHHGLGDTVVRGLLDYVGIEAQEPGVGLRIEVEDPREDTIADLVLYGAGWTVVVEAKTFAVEQPRQLDRLYQHWQDEPDPRFVFLTRGQRAQITARHSRGHWHGLTWQQVANRIRTAADTTTGVAPGVHDYLGTLEAYHRV